MNLFKGLKLLTLVAGLSVSLKAFTYTQFGLVYDKIATAEMDKLEGYEKDEVKGEIIRISAFLNNLDLRLKNSIRFGVDNPIEVIFSDFGDGDNAFAISCSKEDYAKYSKLNADGKIEINEKLKELILKKKMRDFSGEDRSCNHLKALVSSVERNLLKIDGADDLDRRYTSKEMDTISHCDHLDKAGRRTRAFRFSPNLKKKCEQYKELRTRRRKYHDYENKWLGQMYRTKMEFDRTAIGNQTLHSYNICKRDYKPTKIIKKNGKKIKMLAYAVVYMAPGYGTSVMGHLAERWIYCLDDEIQDKLFEYTQMTDKELPYFRRHFGDMVDQVSDKYLKSNVGKLFMKVKHNPGNTELGNYGFFNLYSNRDIIEVYPPMQELEMYEGLQWALKTVKKQEEDFVNEVPWPEYSLFNNNCTHPARQKLEKFSGEWKMNGWQGLTPINIFGFLRKKNAEKVIIYPSQRLLRKLRMLEKGESLFWENTSLWSKASSGKEGKGPSPILLYPETHGLLNKLLVHPTYGAINLGAALIQTVIGIIKAPFAWLAQLKIFRKVKRDENGEPVLGQDGKPLKELPKRDFTFASGIRGVGLSLSEMLGLRMRYPAPTDWTDEERDYIFGELSHHEPKVVDYLLERVQQ